MVMSIISNFYPIYLIQEKSIKFTFDNSINYHTDSIRIAGQPFYVKQLISKTPPAIYVTDNIVNFNKNFSHL